MPYVMIEQYSRYFDVKTRTQFTETLNRRTGCYVGMAQVDKKTAEQYRGRPGFQVLTDKDYLHLTQAPAAPEQSEPVTGDPLADAAQAKAAPNAEPPAPPASK
jgi:hypothetical protein